MEVTAGNQVATPPPEKGVRRYFSELFTEVNLSFRVPPRPLTTAMIASAIPAAIKPYSIAVAPDSSFRKFKIERLMMLFLSGPPAGSRVEPSSKLSKLA